MILTGFEKKTRRLPGPAVLTCLACLWPAGALLAQGAAAQPSFSIVVIPDSQYLVASFTNGWNDQINWIINNQTVHNIKAVMHLGDLVDIANPAQLQTAMWGLNNLRNAGVPLIFAPGNHDQDYNPIPGMMTNLTRAGMTPGWYSNYPNYGAGWSMGFQNPTNLLGSYLLITNGTQPYLLGCTAWLADITNLTWISNVFQTYSNIPAIYLQHIFVGQRGDGRISSWSDPWGLERSGLARKYYSPTYLLTNWIQGTGNIFWVASGHEPNDANAAQFWLPAADGHVQTFTLTDFQNYCLNGTGHQGSNYMQLVTLNPAQNTATVFTFSPTFTNNPLIYSNTAFTFPLSGSMLPPLTPWQQAQQGSAAQGGLAVYANFDGGTPLTDLSPYSARMTGSNLVYTATELGMSASFSNADTTVTGAYVGPQLGGSLYADMELDQFSGLNQVTLSCWLKTTNQAWGAGPHALLGKFNSGTDGDFQLYVTPQSLLRFSIVNASKTRVDLDVNAPAFDDGGWHHFCGVYDGTNMYSYFDGAVVGEIAQTGAIQSTAHAVGIGNNDTQSGFSWRGYLDEVKILTTAWTADQVSNEYQRVELGLQPVGPLLPVLTNSPALTGLLASLPATADTNAPPLFTASLSTNSVLIYPAWASNYVIEFSPALGPGSWSLLDAAVYLFSNYFVVGLPQSFSNMFFRLRY
jgi:hypothetical protein